MAAETADEPRAGILDQLHRDEHSGITESEAWSVTACSGLPACQIFDVCQVYGDTIVWQACLQTFCVPGLQLKD